MAGIGRPDSISKFIDVIDIILPPKDGKLASIASGWGPRNVVNGSANHRAIDFSYPGFDEIGVDTIFSPIDGTVESIGPNYNTVSLRDNGGYLHQFLHNDKILVKSGDAVSAGTPLAIMGGKGPNGRSEFPAHIHYQLRTSDNILLNPIDYWEGRKQTFVSLPVQENGLPVEGHQAGDSVTSADIASSEIPFHNQTDEGDGATISAYRPRMPAVALKSGVVGALLPNRKPGHEPWPRNLCVNTIFINGSTDEYEYNTRLNPQHDTSTSTGSQLIGRLEGDKTINRGPFWRR